MTMRRLTSLLCVAFGAAAIVFAPAAAADPDIDSESAAAVIEELQEQGYTVAINGVPSGDTALLTNCTVTAINDPDPATPPESYPAIPPPGTTVVNVDVACPIQRG